MRYFKGGGFKLFQEQCGFTLVEVVVGVIIVAAVGTGVVKAIETNARANRVLDEKVQATNLITTYLEAIRQMSYSDTAGPYDSVGDTIVKPSQYSVVIDVAYSGDGSTWWPTSNSSALKLQKITISVFRTDGRLVMSTCTFRTER